MRLWLRIALYVGGGGLIITWLDPPAGLAQYALILLFIVAAAYVDAWLFRQREPRSGQNVVSLASLRQSRSRRTAGGGLGHERRVLQMVFSSGFQPEVDELLGLLRSEGLNPIMVSQASLHGEAGHRYEVRLPEREVPKARPLVQFFLLKSARTPS